MIGELYEFYDISHCFVLLGGSGNDVTEPLRHRSGFRPLALWDNDSCFAHQPFMNVLKE